MKVDQRHSLAECIYFIVSTMLFSDVPEDEGEHAEPTTVSCQRESNNVNDVIQPATGSILHFMRLSVNSVGITAYLVKLYKVFASCSVIAQLIVKITQRWCTSSNSRESTRRWKIDTVRPNMTLRSRC